MANVYSEPELISNRTSVLLSGGSEDDRRAWADEASAQFPGEGPLREVGSWLYNLEARLLFAVGCDDVNGTPKVFARGVYDRLALAQGGDLLDLELIAQASRLGVPVVDVPTFGFPRHGGKSSTTFRSAWRMYAGALGLRLRTPRAVRAAKAETEQSHDLDPNRGRLVSAAPADLLPQDGSAGPR